MMEQVANHQLYYEVAYDAIIQAGEPFKTLDITGLRWVEIDTLSDYRLAQESTSAILCPDVEVPGQCACTSRSPLHREEPTNQALLISGCR